ncbi:5-oxoprolinase subunit PxpB [Paenibacillus sp. HB172176]|uniref:5-oxoprolinase subunit PxpB n=1 Tax=Paenibacillus sp. HB172176 TaxID=2493690 RepID=UPI00143BB172|nr:5-oxoprolinase subunit PxpB [Paenibacillus sp. HB172176]
MDECVTKINYILQPLGDSGLLISLGSAMDEATNAKVEAVMRLLQDAKDELGTVEYVPAFASIVVHYNPYEIWRGRSEEEKKHASLFETVCARLKRKLDALTEEAIKDNISSRHVKIPVLYGGEHGPDLVDVARLHVMTEEEVVAIHSGGSYKVYMIGFAPGFPYLGGMSGRIASPRHKTPRIVIPAGSVGIAGRQTGIYPLATPGGWQLIGRTPFTLFNPQREERPSLLQAGDRVSFVPITKAEYEDLREEVRR